MKGKFLIMSFLFLMLIGFVSSCDYYLDGCKHDGWVDGSTYCLGDDLIAKRLSPSSPSVCLNIEGATDLMISLEGHSLINGETGEEELGTGIVMRDSEEIYIDGVGGKIEKFRSRGISVYDTKDLSITDMEFRNNDAGVALSNVEDFEIDLLNIIGQGDGIFGYGLKNGEISTNDVDCNSWGIWGVYLEDVNNTYLGHNNIEDCRQDGMSLINAFFNEIEENDITGVEDPYIEDVGGLFILGSSNKITENEFQDNSAFDIKIEGCLNSLENNVNNNKDIAIVLSEEGCVSVVNCPDLENCALNENEGIFWEGSSIVYNGEFSIGINEEEVSGLAGGDCLVFANLEGISYDEHLCVKSISTDSLTFSLLESDSRPIVNESICLINSDLEDSCLKIGEQMDYKGILLKFLGEDSLEIDGEINNGLEENLCFALGGLEEDVCIKEISTDSIILNRYFSDTIVYYPTNTTKINNSEPENTIDSSGNENACQGCILNNTCYDFGFRNETDYCSGGGFILQREANEICNNNFECESNLCIDSRCVSGSLWAKFIRWLNRIFG
jgi:hypothetical protein